MTEWKDTTSYSRDRERVPTTWSTRVAGLRLTVTCGHITHKPDWIATCRPFFECKPLGISSSNASAEYAQDIAFDLLEREIDKINAALARAKGIDHDG